MTEKTPFFLEELRELRQADLYRELRSLKFHSAVRAEAEGREYRVFCGNDYLGLAHHPELAQAAREAAERYGTGAGASRLISGTTPAHAELEEKLARFLKRGRALVYAAGYMANLGVLSALAGPGDLIVMDKLCHASLIDGARLSGAELRVFPHRNYDRCRRIFKASTSRGRRYLVSDTVFSMDGDLADCAELARIRTETGAMLLLDDAHGIGFFGPAGGGMASAGQAAAAADLVTGTLSKTLGAQGGFVVASPDLIDYLINRSRAFIYATGLSPVLCAAASRALDILEREPGRIERLRAHAERMRSGLLQTGWPATASESAIIPVMTGPEERSLKLADRLRKAGFFVPAIRYPTVGRGQSRLRVTVSSEHTPEDIDALLEALSCLSSDL